MEDYNLPFGKIRTGPGFKFKDHLIFYNGNSYHQTSNISHTLVANKIVNHSACSDIVGTTPVVPAPTTSSFSTQHLALMDWAKTSARQDGKYLSFGIWCILY